MTTKDLDAILNAIVRDGDPADSATVRRAMRRYPQHAQAIADFALAWTTVEQTQQASDVSTVDEAVNARIVARAADRVMAAGTGEYLEPANPLSGLNLAQNRALAKALHLPIALIGKLRDRQIELTSIPKQLVLALAEQLSLSEQAIRAHLNAPPQLPANAQFKSRGKPRAGTKEPFDKALRGSKNRSAIAFWLEDPDQSSLTQSE